MNIKKLDGSFDIIVNGMPYNTTKGDKYFQETQNLFKSNPELFEIEKKKEKTLDELKTDKIVQLKNNCKSYIFSIYPVDKQLNIINPLNDYTEEEKQNMNIFINKNRNICKEKEEFIKKAESNEELEKINIDFNKE